MSWFLGAAAHAGESCDPAEVELRGSWGQARFSVEVADTVDERNLGLMHRPSMPQDAGMLFVYDRPQSVSFWMRNTLIPLDMLFADAAGIVVNIHEMAQPLDDTTIPGGEMIQFVLEVNGGIADLYGIGPGTMIRHPAIPQDVAAWRCQ